LNGGQEHVVFVSADPYKTRVCGHAVVIENRDVCGVCRLDRLEHFLSCESKMLTPKRQERRGP